MKASLRFLLAFVLRDLKLNLKSPERVLSIVFFIVLLIILAQFSFPKIPPETYAAGLFWLIYAFIVLLNFQKNLLFDEITGFQSLIAMSGRSVALIFAAKILSAWLFLTFLHLLSLLAVGFFLSSALLEHFGPFLLLIAALNFGQVVMGFFSAEKTFEVKYSEFLFPLLHLPFTLPLLLAGIVISDGDFFGAEKTAWWLLIFLFDLLYAGLSLAWDYWMEGV